MPRQEDYLSLYKDLVDKREDLSLRLAKLQALKQNAEQELKDLVDEMKKNDTSPETIEDDLKNSETLVKENLTKTAKSLEEFEENLSKAEDALGI